jgi:solute carrier family 35 (adenosine 3'-phospho 5'-phosphosulfate transporter), member B2
VSGVTTMSGVALLALYMVCDSFTSSWQGALFARHGCSPLQMLCGVNLFSCALTAAALAQHAATPRSLALLQARSLLCFFPIIIYYKQVSSGVRDKIKE